MLLAILGALVAWLIRVRPWTGNWPMWLAAAGWLAFNFYWSAAAKNSAPAKTIESAESRRVHQYLLIGALALVFFSLPGLRYRFLPDRPIVAVAGLALQAACGFLGVWARRHLAEQWSGAIAIKVEHRLIRTGPYRLLRHPMYTAWLGMYIGPAIVSGEVHALIGAAMVVFAYMRKIRLEEKALLEAMGSEYAAYRRETWALIPWVL